ncbi:Glyoxalase-like domain-containing protein [Roseivivax lentus]|uniref:Glyoxalase-like domain-containing protein n=1 Tax=Roseivivax lentus TaxID=633194 RepID=A0A1N7LYY7_9RHOB|nr:VOC family protein [Roseivivax lentus]SIS78979.1 Glyoxalase-like domain-containing protein [Roseivivax lentus]
MRLTLDHVAVLGETLAAAVAHCETALPVPLGPGGQHARYGTHNRLLGLEAGLYLEAIAIDPEAPAPEGPRWFGLDDFSGPPRLARWILRTDDMDAALAALPEAGAAVPLARGDLRWRMAVPPSGHMAYDGMFPALIEWQSPTPAGDLLSPSGLTLTDLVIRHPEARALANRLAPHLDAPLLRFETGAPGMEAHLRGPDGPACLT